MALLGLVGVIFILYLPTLIHKISVGSRLQDYDFTKVDSGKLSHDRANGVSIQELERRVVNGYYDKK